MDDSRATTPFRLLGKRLKELRLRNNESLSEASGAVEIDARELANYELGKVRPAEDVLLLLISHFGAKDEEAVKLWEMAGYGTDNMPSVQLGNDNNQLGADSSEQKILFTDVVDIVVNNYGVIMNFMQSGQAASRPVARVGMSREHAKSILQILQATLVQTEQRTSDRTTPENSQKS